MAFNINEIKAQMVGGGARASHFQVTLNNPANASADAKSSFMIRAASLPASSVGVVPVSYFGREVKLSGDRRFEPWTVTVYNDEDFLVRNALEEWSSMINGHKANTTGFGSASPLLYKSDAQVTQFGKAGNVLRVYSFAGLFPTNITQIDVDWSTRDAMEEFQVTFEYDWWEVVGGSTGNGGTTR